MRNQSDRPFSPFLLACLATSAALNCSAVALASGLEEEAIPVAANPVVSDTLPPDLVIDKAAQKTLPAVSPMPEPPVSHEPDPLEFSEPVAAAPLPAPALTEPIPPFPTAGEAVEMAAATEPNPLPVPTKVKAIADAAIALPVADALPVDVEPTGSPAQVLGAIAAQPSNPNIPDALPIESFTLSDVNSAALPAKHADIELAQGIFDTPPPAAPPTAPEAQVLVAEVAVEGAEAHPDLEALIYETIETRPGQTTTRSQLQEDVNSVYATGYFADVTQVPEDTVLGVRVTFAVEVNPVLTRVEAQTLATGSEDAALEQDVIDDIFGDSYGEVLNLRELQIGIVTLNDWYQEQGYDLAQVVGSPQISPDGVVRLAVAEGVIEEIRVRYIDEEENITDDGRTRPFIVTREMQLKPGDVFNRSTAQADLQRVFGLGLFEDVRLAFEPGEDPSKVIVNVDVLEGRTGSVAAGAGVSSASGLFGTVSYQQQNLGGNNQNITAEAQLGERELLFDLSFTDPWIAGDPYRTSYTVNMFRRRSISLIFDEGNPEVRLANNDRPRVVRTGGGINFSRPLSKDVFSRAEWTVSAGFQYQGIRLEDADGSVTPRDSQNNLLSFTNGGRDTLVSLSFGASRDRRNSPLEPTQGSLLRLGVEQTLPIGSGTILFNRLRGSYSYYIPVDWVNFSKDPEAPQALAFNLQGGTVIGDLPPYEAFSLGGANSVRGYKEGDVGAGRSYLQATAEYRFPILSFIGGALFLDYATDLGTGDDVPGNPAGVRGKPGDGFGYGVGVRIQSPLGPIRVDYGFGDDGDSRLHFGIGQRF